MRLEKTTPFASPFTHILTLRAPKSSSNLTTSFGWILLVGAELLPPSFTLPL